MEEINGIVLPKMDEDGNQVVVEEPRAGTKYNVFSHNWCDKCSWYQESQKATDEILSDSGNGLTFNSSHDYWIDITHGRLTDEDRIVYNAGGSKWVPVIKVDDVIQGSGYTINYENGDVIFGSSQSGKTVKATYWYAGNGKFSLTVPTGYKLQLLRVELQFCKDLALNDTMVFTPKGYASVFAPNLVPDPYGPTDLIPLDFPNKYKKVKDFITESNGSYPVIPAFGELTKDIIVLCWTYLSRTDLYGDYGMRIDIEMENNIPLGGEFGTATFYGILKSV